MELKPTQYIIDVYSNKLNRRASVGALSCCPDMAVARPIEDEEDALVMMMILDVQERKENKCAISVGRPSLLFGCTFYLGILVPIVIKMIIIRRVYLVMSTKKKSRNNIMIEK